jgi:hypothetical protein
MLVEFDSDRDTITVDGLIISLAVLRHFVHPEPDSFYQFVREGEITTVTRYQIEKGADA